MTDTAPRRRQVPGGVNGPRIRSLRVERGLTAPMLAKKARCSVGHMCDIERGRRKPSAPLLFRIARELKTSTTSLMDARSACVHG